jgi:hypothetical protein
MKPVPHCGSAQRFSTKPVSSHGVLWSRLLAATGQRLEPASENVYERRSRYVKFVANVLAFKPSETVSKGEALPLQATNSIVLIDWFLMRSLD